jgi:RHS repeat-associated protein
LGRLAEKEDNSDGIRRYVYDRDEVLAELDGAGNVVRRYITRHGIDMLVGVISEGNHYIAGTDSLGTVLGFLDISGEPAGGYQYEAFGAIARSSVSFPNERTFAGREYESVSNLYHMRARFYDPDTGQFLQRDPLSGNAASAPYVYANNSPTNYRDPYGLDATTEAVGLGNFMYKRAGEPLLEDLTGRLAERVVAGAVDAVADNIGLMSGIGSSAGSTAGTLVGVAFQFKDFIKILTADDPTQASIDWYLDLPMNPVDREMMNAFLTMGGTMPRREPRIAPACTSNAPRELLVQIPLRGSRTGH